MIEGKRRSSSESKSLAFLTSPTETDNVTQIINPTKCIHGRPVLNIQTKGSFIGSSSRYDRRNEFRLVVKRGDCLHVGVPIWPPLPLLQRTGKITESPCTTPVPAREREEYLTMREDRLDVFAGGGWKVLELGLDSLEVGASLIWRFGWRVWSRV